ncbi:MAG TPA: ribosome assembly RNA-binding protein YhbY [Longimicrobiales bacterium]|nr:ribosome assembly RNA-binding protein YhbY [Longimicrobiales bacterium]
MEALTAKQRAALKSLAHPLKPILQIGREGVTDATVQSVADAFHNRELLKVKVLEAAPASAREVGSMLAGGIEGSHLVQVIGRTVVLYRRHPDDPQIAI